MNSQIKFLMENPEILPIGIVAAILGSLFTIFLNRAFDLFQTKKEQKYKLQTSFFEQKLKAAEAAVTSWSNVATAYTSLSILYQRMKVNEEFNPNLFDHLNEKFDNQMQEAIRSSEMIANSILLYFDIEDELIYADKPIENLLESLSKIVNLAEQNQAIEESYKFINDPERIKEFEEEQEKIREEARIELEKLSDFYSKARDQMYKAIGNIRSEMKQFDI